MCLNVVDPTDRLTPRRKIARTAAEIWYFWIFQDGGRRHLGFSKFRIFNCRRVTSVVLRHHANIHWNRSNRSRDMWVSILWYFGLKMPIHAPFWVFWTFPQMTWPIVHTYSPHLYVVVAIDDIVGVFWNTLQGASKCYCAVLLWQELIRRWDSERELFNNDIAHT